MEISSSSSSSVSYAKPATTRTSRNWCFTLFGYFFECIEHLLAINCRGIIFQEEMCPTTGQPHLQGFIRFEKGISMQQVKKLFGEERQHVHLEQARAPLEAVEYCRKGETRMGECYEEGDLTFEQGKSHALQECLDDIYSGMSLRDLVANHGIACIQHPRGIQFAQYWTNVSTSPSWRAINVYCLTGRSGAGKTRSVFASFPRVYKLDRSASAGSIWFDGYDGEEVLLIDDFYGWIPYGQLLNLLDGYPVRLDVKGGFTYAKWTTVVITSNASPHQWYPRQHPDGATPALCRRIHHWLSIDDDTSSTVIDTFLTVTPCAFGGPIPRTYGGTLIRGEDGFFTFV